MTTSASESSPRHMVDVVHATDPHRVGVLETNTSFDKYSLWRILSCRNLGTHEEAFLISGATMAYATIRNGNFVAGDFVRVEASISASMPATSP